MDKEDQFVNDIIDEDLYEEFDDEELYELVKKAQREALEREKREKELPKKSPPFPKWVFILISLFLFLNVIATFPEIFSFQVIDFLITSHQLSKEEQIKNYKKAVVVIETGNSRGTGFSIDHEGMILTNEHVVREEENVMIAFPEEGLFEGEVILTDATIDLAIIQVRTDEKISFPYLTLAEANDDWFDEEIFVIGNPLRFQGIVNKGKVIGDVQLSSISERVMMIQAPIYRGNSGSPVIHENGTVIGVVFATYTHKDYGKVGLFIPIDHYYMKIKGEENQ